MLIMIQNRMVIIDTTSIVIKIPNTIKPEIVASSLVSGVEVTLGQYASVNRAVQILRDILQEHAEAVPNFYMPEK